MELLERSFLSCAYQSFLKARDEAIVGAGSVIYLINLSLFCGIRLCVICCRAIESTEKRFTDQSGELSDNRSPGISQARQDFLYCFSSPVQAVAYFRVVPVENKSENEEEEEEAKLKCINGQ